MYAIDVKNLSKNFNGKPAVINASLQVNSGEIYGFLGPNGSGKTTMIRLLCGLLRPDGGNGTCLGYDVVRQTKHIKAQVGYMTQRFSLYEKLTVYENLYFMARIYGMQRKTQVIQQVIEEFGLEKYAYYQAGTLSGGWKQRLALCAALLHKPKLLLLDEPTAGVDPKARRDFWEHLHKLTLQNITILVSTHYMDEAERCSRLAFIFYGNILAQGSADNIIRDSGLVTWEIVANDKRALMKMLEQLPGVENIVTFGNVFHLTGKDAQLLQHTVSQLAPQLKEQQRIMPTLEDVFITLTTRGSHGIHEEI